MFKFFSLEEADDAKYKWVITFKDIINNKIKKIKFGAYGYSDFTINKDEERRQRYMARHKKRENWNDPFSKGALSYFILWTAPSLIGGLTNYLNYFRNKNLIL